MKTVLTPFLIGSLLLISLPGCRKDVVEETENTKTSPAAVSEGAGEGSGLLPGGGTENRGAVPPPPTTSMSGTVVETMNTGGYTYVLVEEGEKTFWAAAPEFKVAVGEKVTVPPGMPMTDYHSQSLDRDFDLVYFVSAIAVGEGAAAPAGSAAMPGDHPAPGAGDTPVEIDFADLEKVEGGYTVADLFSRQSELAGQQVSIRGKVVKFSSQIMGMNWIHLQDGTDHEGSNDLTITTSSSARKGDTILVSGVLVKDKDFGAGYRYEVIIEDAEVTVE